MRYYNRAAYHHGVIFLCFGGILLTLCGFCRIIIIGGSLSFVKVLFVPFIKKE